MSDSDSNQNGNAMRQIVVSANAPARVVGVPLPALKAGSVLVRTAFGAVSVGTERVSAAHGHTSLWGKIRSHPDKVRQVIDMARKNGVRETFDRVNEVLERWNATGYSCAGVVAAVGANVPEFRVGDLVACGGGGYALHADYCAIPRRLLVKLPSAVSLEEAAFTTIGAIAMQGVRQAEITPCAKVAVIGLGIVGQLTCQIAAASGAIVTAMDLQQARIDLAVRLGASHGVVIGPGAEREKAMELTDGRGYDIVFLTAATASSEPASLATAIARDRGRLVVVGDVGLNLDRQLMYEKELGLRLSRSYGPGRYDASYEEEGNDYPYGYVRWTEQRNMESFLALLSLKRISVEPLITHRYTIEEAEKAYETVVKPQGAPPIGIVLEYSQPAEIPSQYYPLCVAPAQLADRCSRLGIGFIGVGAFARSILLPALSKAAIDPIGIVSSTGVGPVQVGKKYGFTFASTDFEALLVESRISALFIATRHDSHANMVIRGIKAGKAVFVEKPLATTPKDLQKLCEAQLKHRGNVMVGFNRRFAPLTQRLRSFLGENHGPLVMSMRINAGAIQQHWSLAASEGGRIIGEACHFVDLLAYLAGSPIRSVYARSIPVLGERLEENICATLTFANGSVANLSYNAIGDPSLPKEYLEIFGDGRAAVLEDFSQLRLVAKGRTEVVRERPDKGHREEMHRFVASLLAGEPSPIPFEESVQATQATFAIVDSCRSGMPVEIDPTNIVA